MRNWIWDARDAKRSVESKKNPERDSGTRNVVYDEGVISGHRSTEELFSKTVLENWVATWGKKGSNKNPYLTPSTQINHKVKTEVNM